ncbi:interleukin-2 receptor subunit alpha [Perognathus longimembris pacificus]|uniref:interleukin-2 receptor subunit alpha n=1 Tax=Perognathus longimembris pacificus TaxID=214514 RepID=UPI00201931AB|nr:interleukin-2 receptor subunit alpha [Perognathus longimembris pacificus]
MEPRWLVWGLWASLVVPGYLTELCESDPPHISRAAFTALAYKEGTLLNCECKDGFRRIKYGSSYVTCTENSSWDSKCQCERISNHVPKEQLTPQPEEQKERKTTEMHDQTHPEDPMNRKGFCREPPSWEHEGQKRIYQFVVGQTVHYQCIQGYKALQGSQATSTCKMICGKTRWSQPRLTCVKEGEQHWFPGEEALQVSSAAPPDTGTSCLPATTTDFPSPTEAATTPQPLLFTMEYQVAVAGCVFLLLSVLLLSGLTWRRRWKKSRRAI